MTHCSGGSSSPALTSADATRQHARCGSALAPSVPFGVQMGAQLGARFPKQRRPVALKSANRPLSLPFSGAGEGIRTPDVDLGNKI